MHFAQLITERNHSESASCEVPLRSRRAHQGETECHHTVHALGLGRGRMLVCNPSAPAPTAATKDVRQRNYSSRSSATASIGHDRQVQPSIGLSGRTSSSALQAANYSCSHSLVSMQAKHTGTQSMTTLQSLQTASGLHLRHNESRMCVRRVLCPHI